MDSSSESESDEDRFDDPNSGPETGDGESQTSDDDDEIDLENLKLDDDSAMKSSYTSKSGMIWSSVPRRLTEKNSSNDTIQKSGLTNITENISSVEDAFMCFIPQVSWKNFDLFKFGTCSQKHFQGRDRRNNNHRIESIHWNFTTCWFIG